MADETEGQAQDGQDQPSQPDTPAYDPNVTIVSNDPADADLNKPPAEAAAAESEEAPDDAAAKPDAGDSEDEGSAAAADEGGEPEEASAEDDSEQAAAGEGEEEGDEPKKTKPRRRYNRREKYKYALNRAYTAEQRARELERELEELRGSDNGDQPPARRARREEPEPREAPAPKKADAPKREDFDDVEDFIIARTKFEMAQEMEDRLKAERVAIEARLVADRDRQAAQEAEEAEAQALTDWQARVDETAEGIDDFDTVIDANKDVPVSAPMRDFMLDSPVGPRMLYELAKDTDLAEEINGLPPLRALAAMGRLEARLSAATEQPKPKPKPRLPKPPSPVGGGATTPSVDLETADYQTYKKVMNKHELELRQQGR